ncbi:MAG: hypothetical protein LQ338_001130 [Usnochroma carphineum]|nr:MAG: hypothetical protein LQ338_001130 [Usnochroma carphineum]
MPPKRKRQAPQDSIDENNGLGTSGLDGGQPAAGGGLSLGLAQEPKTPSKRRRGRPPGSATKPKATPDTRHDQETPRSKQKGKKLFETPSKAKVDTSNGAGNPIVRNADRSARRKCARSLVERSIAAEDGGDEEIEEEDSLAKQIWDADGAEEDGIRDSSDEEPIADPAAPVTPSKRGRKGTRRKRTPTPPQDLPPHEQYFFQNRPGNTKTSNNTFSTLSILSHEQYHRQISTYKDPHSSSYAFLHSLHSRSFPQWRFELSQSFNICLYGYGSKRHLTSSFASYLHSYHPSPTPPKIIVANGYTPTLTIRQILTTVACAIYDSPSPSSLPAKLPTQPQQLLSTILHELDSSPPKEPFYLLINSLDAPPLRRAPIPSLLAQLASSRHIHLLATCDTPNFPLLWDTNLREQYNWLFHDATTYISYGGVEIEDVVEEVNELMGRSGRRIKGKEGVGFVLRSLPENARGLYRVLVAELLSLQDGGLDADGRDPEDDGEDEEGEDASLVGTLHHKSHRGRGKLGEATAGIEYRALYQKVVEEFICSTEMGFRQLLKEFHDHQMVVSRRDGTGAEVLGVPFRREEMEAILEDLMG